MKKIKMRRTIERGGQQYHGDHECVVDDSIADALVAEGHAYLLETVEEQEQPKAKEALVESDSGEETEQLVSDDEDEHEHQHHGHSRGSKRRKK